MIARLLAQQIPPLRVVRDKAAPCGGNHRAGTTPCYYLSGSELKFYLPNQLRRMCQGAGLQGKVWVAYKSDASAAPELIFFVALWMLPVSSCLDNQLPCRIFSGSLLPLRSSPKAKLSVDSSPAPNNGNFLLLTARYLAPSPPQNVSIRPPALSSFVASGLWPFLGLQPAQPGEYLHHVCPSTQPHR